MEDTIAAIATAYGEGGIGIVRISGERALEILQTVFEPVRMIRIKGGPLQPDAVGTAGGEPIVNRRFTYGWVRDPETNQQIDEVMAVYMKAPYTYTMEDVAEIHCHGSMVALSRTLSLVCRYGARLAERGEFTKRAFLNGRIDLSQAEAVIDLIRAKTGRGYEVALGQIEGRLSGKVKELRNDLMDLLVLLAVNIDYSEEDIEEIRGEDIIKSILPINDEIAILMDTADQGRILREGLRIVIAGKPNVGKSSLMNALLRDSRAIVTEVPGTTRDTIEESLNIGGIPLVITDTAGIRETEDAIEKMGIQRSKDAFDKADLILLMVNGTEPLEQEDRDIISQLSGRKVIVLLNKMDLKEGGWDKEVAEEIRILLKRRDAPLLYTSMKEERGIKELEQTIVQQVMGGSVWQGESGILINARHQDLLFRAHESLRDGEKGAREGLPLDLIEVDIRQAWTLLGEILGEAAGDHIIDEVFERFCLGK